MPESPSLVSLQAALDRARALGLPIAPPIVRRDAPAPPAASRPAAAGPQSSFEDLLHQAAAAEGIDPSLLKAVAKAESNLDANAVSSAGAKGVMQLMDATARDLGVTNSFDPAQNIAGGAKYLKQMLTRYGGDVKRALAAYNAGPGAVDSFGGVPPYAETQAYVEKILRSARGS